MLKTILLPVLTVFGGAAGYFLRRLELATAFDANGLAAPWAPVSILLAALSLVMVILFVWACRGIRRKPDPDGAVFFAPGCWVYLAAVTLSAANLLVAGLFGLREEFSGGGLNILRLLLWLMCLLSFVCVLVSGLNNFRSRKRKFDLTLLAPAYTFCLWLVVAYQQRAAEPVVLSYMYELFAIICTLLGLYFTAGFSFGRGKFRRCAVFCLLSVYFDLVTLADGHDLVFRLLLIFSVLYQLATAVVLLHHAFSDPKDSPADQEMNPTQEVIPDE